MSLLRLAYSCSSSMLRRAASLSVYSKQVTQVRLMSSSTEETDAEFDARYEAFFNRPDIDGWEVSTVQRD